MAVGAKVGKEIDKSMAAAASAGGKVTDAAVVAATHLHDKAQHGLDKVADVVKNSHTAAAASHVAGKVGDAAADAHAAVSDAASSAVNTVSDTASKVADAVNPFNWWA